MRADQQTLTEIALEMLWKYCCLIIGDFGWPDDENRAWKRYDPQEFMSFCEQYKEEKIREGDRIDAFQAQSLPL